MPQADDHSFLDSRTGAHGRRPYRPQPTLERFFELLIAGDRVGSRDFLREFLGDGRDSIEALTRFVWPACAMIDSLSRKDQITAVHEQCALLLLGQVTQRLESGLEKRPARCRTVLVASGRTRSEELAAEVFAGICEADGFDVVLLGGGIEWDDLYAYVGQRCPDFVVSFAAAGADAPKLRRLIDTLRTHDPVPGLRIGVGGGVFERVPGLADEIGAHFSGDSPFEMLDALRTDADRLRSVPRNIPRSKAA
jgi:hypothetical protein